MTSLELLTPARNTDIGIAAVRCGADAVYIGGPAFGARAAAGNSVEDIARLCREAALFGVRVYVTVNTLAKDDDERLQIVAAIESLRGIGVSAFILQDTTLLSLLMASGPWKEEFHASTQCAIRTPQRAMELAGMGFSRLILERELSLGDIRAIHSAVPDCELEFFVHGALCVCYSGDCYLSEALSGRSANRGECSQPCRSRYDLVDSEGRKICRDKPLLSLKDLCLIDKIEDLARCGVVSFKIEGRLKNESYVKNVVRAYDLALTSLIEKYPEKYRRSSRGRVEGGFTPDLEKTFNRGYTTLFIDGERNRGFWSGDSAKGMGAPVGTVSAISWKRQFIEVDAKASLSNGDGLCALLPQGEVVGFRADKVDGNKVFCKVPESLVVGSGVWRNRDAAFERSLESSCPSRVIDVPISLEFKDGSIMATAEGLDITVPLPRDVSPADNQQRMRLVIENQISRTASPYRFSLAEIRSDGPLPFLSAAFLNSVRREMATALSDRVLTGYREPHRCPVQIKKAGGSHPRRETELMRSKYCIRYQLGMCLKESENQQRRELFLVNNGTRIPLKFDCAGCEMVLKAPELSNDGKRQ